MAQAQLKTTATEVPVPDFIAALPDPRRRADAATLDTLHRQVTGCEPKMWGPSIIGYGQYTYSYDSGREGTMCRAGFSPRKAATTVYLTGIHAEARSAKAEALLAALGPHTTGKACLYLKRLDGIDMTVLEALIRRSWDALNARWPE